MELLNIGQRAKNRTVKNVTEQVFSQRTPECGAWRPREISLFCGPQLCCAIGSVRSREPRNWRSTKWEEGDTQPRDGRKWELAMAKSVNNI